MNHVNFRLLCVTDRTQVAEGPLDDWLAILCWNGLRGVSLREKDLDPGALLQLATTCRPIFDRHHIQWTINGSLDIARRAESTGVHLTSTQDVAAVRHDAGPAVLVGRSVHAVAEGLAAAAAGADYLVFGPVYATPAKAGYGNPSGLDPLRALAAASPVPVFAIGGITPDRAEECRKAGAHGVAVMSGLMRTEVPDETLARYEHALGSL
jgi:thiamine-phosphate pyrophosphorylase